MGFEKMPEGAARVQRAQLEAFEAPFCEPQQEGLSWALDFNTPLMRKCVMCVEFQLVSNTCQGDTNQAKYLNNCPPLK